MENIEYIDEASRKLAFEQLKPWGLSCAMVIRHCDPAKIKSAAAIQDFTIQLCKLIEMERFGDCQVVRFGTGNKEGYSMFQLIQTSNISGHFAEESNRAFIDIFSCKYYDVEATANFAMEFFGGSEVSYSAEFRD